MPSDRSPADTPRVEGAATTEPAFPERVGAARLIAGYAVPILAAPYLFLKIVWLAGGQLGVADPGIMRDPSMIALNALTAGMDLVGIAIALAFTHRWGLRLPAWLVLPPIWVATGLLARFVVVVPVAAIGAALRSAPAPDASGPVHSWVYTLVYTEFVGMGIALTASFVLYARTRWAFVFHSIDRQLAHSPTDAVLVPLACAGAILAAAVGGLNLAWAFGATLGRPPQLAAQRTFVSHVVNATDGTLMLAGAVGVLALVRGWRRLPMWAAIAMAWIGGGSVFGWGLWHLVNVLGSTALVRARAEAMASVNLLALIQVIAGLIIAVVMLIALSERVPTRSA